MSESYVTNANYRYQNSANDESAYKPCEAMVLFKYNRHLVQTDH